MGAAVMAGCDPSPVFEFPEHILDPVPLSVEGLSYSRGSFLFFLGGMQGVMPISFSPSLNQSAS